MSNTHKVLKGPNENIAYLAVSLRGGNKSAFGEIFNIYERKLYHFVFSMTKSDFATEDILQEVFLKVWMKRETINPSSSFDSFIYAIARNHTYNHLRRIANQKSLRKEVWRSLKHYNRQTEDTILLEEYQDIVNDILESLPVKKRSIFILSKQQGKTNQEIADLLNISPKTVKNHLWKTLQLIKAQLQPYIVSTVITFLFIGFLI